MRNFSLRSLFQVHTACFTNLYPVFKKTVKNFIFSQPDVSRRQFLGDCGKMTGIGAMASILNLSLTGKVLAARASGSITDYKGLVCIFLGGGNDSFNMLTPGVADYANYTQYRGVVARPALESFNVVDQSNGLDYHVHSSMANTRNMFTAGDLSYVANVGTLHEPMTMHEYRTGAKKRPFGTFSHYDQRRQWQNSLPREKGGAIAGTGWVGRMSEVLNDAANNNAIVNANMSPGGRNILQTSRTQSPLPLVGGANPLDHYLENVDVKTAMDADLEHLYSGVLHNHYNHMRKEAVLNNNDLVSVEENTVINTPFPTSNIGNQLLRVLKYISAQGPDQLGANRQTFYVNFGGFDMHRGVTVRLAPKLEVLNDALHAFNEGLKEIGYHDRVVTYTASDFGRSLAPNTTGTDHGWGGNQIIMGGPVNGGRVFGTYPEMARGGSTDIGRGRQLPTTSIDELHASIAYWFGVNNDNEMETILPNIRNFWAAGAAEQAIPELFDPNFI